MMQLRVNNKRKGERTNFRNQILLLRETFRRGREREREHCLAWRHLFPLLLCSSCILSLCILSLSPSFCVVSEEKFRLTLLLLERQHFRLYTTYLWEPRSGGAPRGKRFFCYYCCVVVRALRSSLPLAAIYLPLSASVLPPFPFCSWNLLSHLSTERFAEKGCLRKRARDVPRVRMQRSFQRALSPPFLSRRSARTAS